MPAADSPMADFFMMQMCRLIFEQNRDNEKYRSEDTKELQETCLGIGRELDRTYIKLLGLNTLTSETRNKIDRGLGTLQEHEKNANQRYDGLSARLQNVENRVETNSRWLRAEINARIDVHNFRTLKEPGRFWNHALLLRTYGVTESGWDDDDDDARKKFNQRLLAIHEWTALEKATFVHRDKAHRALASELGLDYDRIQDAMNEKDRSTQPDEDESEGQESVDDNQEEDKESVVDTQEEEEEVQVLPARSKNTRKQKQPAPARSKAKNISRRPQQPVGVKQEPTVTRSRQTQKRKRQEKSPPARRTRSKA
ncbi:MAG: hypothetical protein Q9212_006623 [Teloschistes hypoglaucus]